VKWGAVLGVLVVVFLIILYEWPKINPDQKKEKKAFVVVTAIGCLLAFLLIYFPHVSSPTQWVEAIFKPLGKTLE
jgi:multisubunit Na+/H+ antiporter MnhB subunit